MTEQLVDFEGYRYLQRAWTIFSNFLYGSPESARLKNEERGGGYLCITDHSGHPLLISHIGLLKREKALKYRVFCEEKAKRLAEHPEHSLSRQSRDPEKEQWSGAVRGKNYIFSFSGLPELLDELLVFYLAESMMEVTPQLLKDLHLDHPNEYEKIFGSPRMYTIPH